MQINWATCKCTQFFIESKNIYIFTVACKSCFVTTLRNIFLKKKKRKSRQTKPKTETITSQIDVFLLSQICKISPIISLILDYSPILKVKLDHKCQNCSKSLLCLVSQTNFINVDFIFHWLFQDLNLSCHIISKEQLEVYKQKSKNVNCEQFKQFLQDNVTLTQEKREKKQRKERKDKKTKSGERQQITTNVNANWHHRNLIRIKENEEPFSVLKSSHETEPPYTSTRNGKTKLLSIFQTNKRKNKNFQIITQEKTWSCQKTNREPKTKYQVFDCKFQNKRKLKEEEKYLILLKKNEISLDKRTVLCFPCSQQFQCQNCKCIVIRKEDLVQPLCSDSSFLRFTIKFDLEETEIETETEMKQEEKQKQKQKQKQKEEEEKKPKHSDWTLLCKKCAVKCNCDEWICRQNTCSLPCSGVGCATWCCAKCLELPRMIKRSDYYTIGQVWCVACGRNQTQC